MVRRAVVVGFLMLCGSAVGVSAQHTVGVSATILEEVTVGAPTVTGYTAESGLRLNTDRVQVRGSGQAPSRLIDQSWVERATPTATAQPVWQRSSDGSRMELRSATPEERSLLRQVQTGEAGLVVVRVVASNS